MKRILCISRAERYSPNSEERDAKIFRSVVEELIRKGAREICTVAEDCFTGDTKNISVIISMARSHRVIDLLRCAERKKIKVINPTIGLTNCQRDNLVAAMKINNIAHPLSIVVGRDEKPQLSQFCFPLWVKRGDGCACGANDVCYIENSTVLDETLNGFWQRNIKSVVLSKHLEGDLIKFYGVADTDFFHVFYTTEEGGFSKFGLESINGKAHHHPFSIEKLHSTATKLAKALKLPIYGGDAIVSCDGRTSIIDFNDFPSFSPCCKNASEAIAQFVYANEITEER